MSDRGEEKESHPVTDRGENETRWMKVDWELPAGLLKDLREYCRDNDIREIEVVSRAIRRFLYDRLLDEGE